MPSQKTSILWERMIITLDGIAQTSKLPLTINNHIFSHCYIQDGRKYSSVWVIKDPHDSFVGGLLSSHSSFSIKSSNIELASHVTVFLNYKMLPPVPSIYFSLINSNLLSEKFLKCHCLQDHVGIGDFLIYA